MPKLTQQQINAAKDQGYEGKTGDEPLKPLPVEQGQAYVYKLVACTSGPAKSNPNKIQWTWELQLDARYHPEYVGTGYLEKVWHYTPTEQEWAIAKMLHAFGYSLDTDTDELINDEATVLAYLTVETFNNKPKMRARRFAYHDEEEYPQAKSPIQQEAEEQMAGYAASQGIPQGPAHPASVANPTGGFATTKPDPQEDPWAVGAPEPGDRAVPPMAGDSEDTF